MSDFPNDLSELQDKVLNLLSRRWGTPLDEMEHHFEHILRIRGEEEVSYSKASLARALAALVTKGLASRAEVPQPAGKPSSEWLRLPDPQPPPIAREQLLF